MVHSGILPHHPRWAKLFENLRYVIIDELHAYRGVFGSHLCNVLRRLRRICRHYGSNPVFLCSSATIANPRELAERLTEQPFELVDESGAPRGEKFFVFVNPPVVNQQLGIRRSYLGETRRVASEFLKRNLQLIVFAQSRLATEILTTYLKDDFEGMPGAPRADPRLPRRLSAAAAPRDREGAARGRGARGGVDQRARARHRHRRARRLGDGRLSGHDCRDVAARRARRTAQRPVGGGDGGEQRAARSVRRPQPVVLLRRVARARADRSRQPAHPGRSHQVRGVRAAVHARPKQFGRHDVQEILGVLAEQGLVHRAERATSPWTWTNESYPADAVSLRSVSSDNFVVVDTTRERGSSARPTSPAARPRCTRRRSTSSKARCIRWSGSTSRAARRSCAQIDCDYYTDAITYTKVTPIDTFAAVRCRSSGPDRRSRRTAKSTSSRASSASRRSSSTRTRTSARASSICRSSRCTRRRTG